MKRQIACNLIAPFQGAIQEVKLTDNPLAADDQCEEGLDTPGPGEFGSGLVPAEGSGGLPQVIPVSVMVGNLEAKWRFICNRNRKNRKLCKCMLKFLYRTGIWNSLT